MIIVGILLEVVAAALGTTSKQLIAYSEHVHQKWISYVGASINIAVGPLVDASAYAFAPQVVVAPFACLDVIFNALTAPYTLRWQNEKLSRVHVVATGLVAIGAFCTAVFGSVHDDILTVYQLEAQLTQPAPIVYLGVELFLIVTMYLAMQARLLSSTVRGIALGVMAGILMGNVFFVKGFIGVVRTSISAGDIAAWERPTPYILMIGAGSGSIVGFLLMRRGLGEYKGIFMVTIFEGAHITAACLSGCIVMSEMAHAPWWQYVLYWISVLMIVAGIVLINTAAMDSKLAQRARREHLAAEKHPNELTGTDQASPLLDEHSSAENGAKSEKIHRMDGGRTPSSCERLNGTSKSYVALDNVNIYQSDSDAEAGIRHPAVEVKKGPLASIPGAVFSLPRRHVAAAANWLAVH